MKKKNIMEMIKSCVSNYHIYHAYQDILLNTKITVIWRCTRKQQTKFTKYIQKQKRVKKHVVKHRTNYQKYTSKKLITSCTSKKFHCVTVDSKV